MFIKRNRTTRAGKTYESVLLVRGKRIPAKRPPGRPRADAPPPKTAVVHETLANLSRPPADSIALIEEYCRRSRSEPVSPTPQGAATPAAAGPVYVGPCYGLLAGLRALARELGIVRAVDEATRLQRLALYLVYARLAFRGSRLSAVRASEDHAVGEVLGVGAFDEEDLYAALEYLAKHQQANGKCAGQPAGTGGGLSLRCDQCVFPRATERAGRLWVQSGRPTGQKATGGGPVDRRHGRAAVDSTVSGQQRPIRPPSGTRWRSSGCALGPRRLRWWGIGG